MSLNYFFVVIFSLNMVLSFCLTLCIDPQDKEEPMILQLMGYALACTLFTLLALILSQIAYLIQFFLPAILNFYILSILVCLILVFSFLIFSRIILNMKDHERRRIIPFVLINTLAILLSFGPGNSFISHFYVLIIVGLVGISWLLSLLFSYIFKKKMQLEMPNFSVGRLPIFIMLVGVVILVLTPFTSHI
ncbi:MAG: hypothetical protein ACRCVN_06390 [Spirochaetia bacterium]